MKVISAARSLIWILLVLAQLSSAQEERSFKSSAPHRCDKWFSKDPPEIAPFKETVEAHPLHREMEKDFWRDDSRFARSQYILNSLRIVSDTLKQDPFVAQSAEMKALLWAWALGTWIPKIKEIEESMILDTAEAFVRRNFLAEKEYSSFDLKRILRSIEIFYFRFIKDNDSHRFLQDVVFKPLLNEIESRRLLEQRSLVWMLGFPKLLASSSGLLKKTDGSELVILAQTAVAALRDDLKSSKLQQASTMALWISNLNEISSLHFRTTLDVYTVFANYARSKGFTLDEGKILQTALESVVKKSWGKNPAAFDAGMALAQNPIEAKTMNVNLDGDAQ